VWILNINKFRKSKWRQIHLLAKKDAEAVGDNAAQPTATKMPSITDANGFGT